MLNQKYYTYYLNLEINRMKKLKYLLILLFIVSCGEDKSEEKTAQEQIDERAKIIYDSTRIQERKLFLEKYNPSSISDSTFKYTYQLQELISNTYGYYKVKGNIVDILMREDVYVLKIVGDFSNEIAFLELDMTTNVFEKVKESLVKNKNFMNAEFIFELIDFNVSTGFKAKSDDSEEFSFDIRYDFMSVTYFIKGNLVDLFPLDK